jgi:type 1 glutamine amidotransferase
MESGKGVVGIRTASHAFQTWLDFDHEVLGGDYKGHANDKTAQVSINLAAKDHPVLEGVEPFTTDGKLYTNAHPASDITVLLTAKSQDNRQPVAWVRTRPDHHDQRVFYTSLGVPEDFQNENFRRLVANAILWTGRSQPKAR